MQINFMNQSDQDSWRNYKTYLEPILKKTLDTLNHDLNVSVSVVLVNNSDIHQMNKDFRNIDRPTDVLSFEDGSFEDGLLNLGDIIISVDALRQQAQDYGHSLKREFCFLVAHGYLHLLGYDHQTEEEEKQMFGLQKEILNGIADKNN